MTTRSDLFSLGAVLYEMVTGAKAFAASDVTGILRNVVEGAPKPAHEVNPELPPALTRFIDRLIAKNPEERYPTAVEALEELEKIEAEVLTSGPAEAEPAKDVDDGLTLSLRGQQQQVEHPTGATAPDYDDATPAVGSRSSESGSLSRRIPAPLFWIVVLVLILGAGSALYSTYRGIDAAATPTITYSPAQLRAFETKKTMLQNARSLFRAGRLSESLAAYDAFVTRYPESVVARTERADVQSAVERAAEPKTKLTVTEKRPRRTPTTVEPEKPAGRKSIWRRIFGGGSKSEPKTP